MDVRVAELSQSQRERLAFIEFRAYLLGEIRRADIINRFGIATAAATRDLTLYRLLAPDNLVLDARSKIYIARRDFRPVFEHPPERVLAALSLGFGEGLGGPAKALVPCEIPRPLIRPNVTTLAPITQAIYRKKAARITYHSFSSGKRERDIVPFALVNNGLRWHVRSFDRKTGEFRDFVLTRIEASEVIEDSCVEEHEASFNDVQWSRIVELELVPHPKEKDPQIVAMDYGMKEPEFILKTQVRAALVGYLLRQWSVDCSSDHHLDGKEVRLWLRNSPVLYGIGNASLAPGYDSSMQTAQ